MYKRKYNNQGSVLHIKGEIKDAKTYIETAKFLINEEIIIAG